VGASSPADSDITDEYAVYEAVGKIAAEMFAEYLKQDGQILRVSAILSVCGQDGLKNAVSAKKDPTFVNLLTKYIRLDRFHNLPSYAILSAQNVVNHMSVAYELGTNKRLIFHSPSQLPRKTPVVHHSRQLTTF
jgi:hypothetical protein